MANDDLLFEHRNKEYGAYKLRIRYKKTVILSLVISCFSVFLVFFIPFIITLNKQLNDEVIIKVDLIPSELIQLEKIEIPKHEEIKPLKSKMNEVVIQKPSNDSTPKQDTSVNKFKAGTQVEKIAENIESNKDKTKDARLKSEALFSCGGDPMVFRNWFYQNFKYPDSLKSKKIEGKLLIQFTVDKRGLVDSVRIISPVYPAIDNLVKQLIMNAPRWKPCEMNGISVKQMFNFPIYLSFRK